MQPLPQCILDLIDYYVGLFVTHESLPKLSAVRRLILKSNSEIFREYAMYNVAVGYPLVVFQDFAAVHHWFSFNNSRGGVQPDDMMLMISATHMCAKLGRSTCSLYWLLRRKGIDSHPRYSEILKLSMLFRLLVFIDV